MIENDLVLYRVFVPVQETFFHVIGNVVNQRIFKIPIFPIRRHIDHAFDVVAIETILGVSLRICQAIRFLLQNFLLWFFEGLSTSNWKLDMIKS